MADTPLLSRTSASCERETFVLKGAQVPLLRRYRIDKTILAINPPPTFVLANPFAHKEPEQHDLLLAQSVLRFPLFQTRMLLPLTVIDVGNALAERC